jgi:hypothetical protein
MDVYSLEIHLKVRDLMARHVWLPKGNNKYIRITLSQSYKEIIW